MSADPRGNGLVRPHLVGIPIYKMTGSGNDFVVVDARVTAPTDWTPEDIQAACARGTGIGADGLVFVGPGSEPGAIRMIYFNADGSHAAMCGNAALCSTRLGAVLGLAPGEAMRLETDAGVYHSRVADDPHRSELHLTPVETPRDVAGLTLAPGETRAAQACVGVPHLVVLVETVDGVELASRGRALRFDRALGPEGANVNFVSPGPDGAWSMRTYERGIEGETLACGTGAVAAALALQEWGLAKVPINIITRTDKLLRVQASKVSPGRYDDVWLSGEGRIVFRGVLS